MKFLAFILLLVEFIFSSFWVWLGFTIQVYIFACVVIALVKACKRNRKVTAYRIGQRWRVEAENTTVKELREAIGATTRGEDADDAGEVGNGTEQ